MANNSKDPKDVRQVRKVTLWSKNEIEKVGGHQAANKILSSARDEAIRQVIESK